MDALTRLQSLLKDLFQLDSADLDFGLYRLYHIKRQELEAFIQEQIPESVRQAFQAVEEGQKDALQDDVEALAQRIRAEVDNDPIDSDGSVREEYRQTRFRTLREAIAQYETAREALQQAQTTEAQQIDVFNHLYAFFRRYYEDGDFIPKRRYGSHETYAVPYDGQEVYLHWANKDQHYVKSAEHLRDYAFSVEAVGGPYRVRFRLAAATQPRENTKGEARYFFPQPDQVTYAERTLTIPFEYRLPTAEEEVQYGKNAKGQAAILEEAVGPILEAISEDTLALALKAIVRETDKEQVSLLLHRLRHFCRKQTSDYFVHKDLRGFLLRELEFYIKDQVLHLADMEGDLAAKLRSIRVLRRVAEDIIAFLDQLERVQCRLFEKQKFVLSTEYLCPIQHVPRELWPVVLANEAQRAAWDELYGLEGELDEAFLRAHPTLVVNTAHFDEGFKDRLLAAFEDLDEATDGLLVHGENYQALQMLSERYRGQVQCTYIDPPYNREDDDFPYKEGYKHSTWLTMIQPRLSLGRTMLSTSGVIIVSIDENEQCRLEMLMNDVFGMDNAVAPLIWEGGRKNDSRFVSLSHEVMLCYALNKVLLQNLGVTWRIRKEGIDDIYRKAVSLRKALGEDYQGISERLKEWLGGLRDNHPAKRHRHYSAVDERGVYFPSDISWPGGGGPTYEVLHPVTGRPCVVPSRGWMYPTKERMLEAIEANLVHFWQDETKVPCSKAYLSDNEGQVPNSVFYRDGRAATKRLRQVLGGDGFPNPKDELVLGTWIQASSTAAALVLDYFAGSGTTGHAVINLNREDRGQHKFILVEMADYFDTVLLPRIQKVMYCPDWKDGRPVAYPDRALDGGWPGWVGRTPRLVKVLRIEGYEDALHNLSTEETLARERERAAAYKEALGPREYRLRYLARLPLEASATLLAADKLEHPFHYTLEVLTDEGPVERPVDLVETFNYLYGLRVRRVETLQNPADGRDYRLVSGNRGQGERVLVIWRDTDGLDAATERTFMEERIAGHDKVLINGDSALPGVQSLDPLFKRLMEATQA
jgi:adenine-specific DNA-methyltransferase